MNILRFSVGSEEKGWLFDVSLLLRSYAGLISIPKDCCTYCADSIGQSQILNISQLRIAPDQYSMSGLAEKYEVEEALGIKMPEGDYNSIGGFMCTTIDRIPTLVKLAQWRLQQSGFALRFPKWTSAECCKSKPFDPAKMEKNQKNTMKKMKNETRQGQSMFLSRYKDDDA